MVHGALHSPGTKQDIGHGADNSLNLSVATSLGSLGSALLKMCLDTQPPSQPEEEREMSLAGRHSSPTSYTVP